MGSLHGPGVGASTVFARGELRSFSLEIAEAKWARTASASAFRRAKASLQAPGKQPRVGPGAAVLLQPQRMQQMPRKDAGALAHGAAELGEEVSRTTNQRLGAAPGSRALESQHAAESRDAGHGRHQPGAEQPWRELSGPGAGAASAGPRVADAPAPGASGSLVGPTAAGLRDLEGTGLRDLGGAGLRDLEGTGLRDLGGAGLEELKGARSPELEGTGPQVLEGAESQVLEGTGPQVLEGTGPQVLEGAESRELEGTGSRKPEGEGQEWGRWRQQECDVFDGSHNLGPHPPLVGGLAEGPRPCETSQASRAASLQCNGAPDIGEIAPGARRNQVAAAVGADARGTVPPPPASSKEAFRQSLRGSLRVEAQAGAALQVPPAAASLAPLHAQQPAQAQDGSKPHPARVGPSSSMEDVTPSLLVFSGALLPQRNPLSWFNLQWLTALGTSSLTARECGGAKGSVAEAVHVETVS